MGAARKRNAVAEQHDVRQQEVVPEPVIPKIPFRDRFWYMQEELQQVHRARAWRRRRHAALRLIRPLTALWRRAVSGALRAGGARPLASRRRRVAAVALAAAALLVLLLIRL